MLSAPKPVLALSLLALLSACPPTTPDPEPTPAIRPEPPTGLSASWGYPDELVGLRWQLPSAGDVLIARTLSGDTTAAPVDGRNYSVGELLEDGSEVVYLGGDDRFDDPAEPLLFEAVRYRAWTVDAELDYSAEPAAVGLTVASFEVRFEPTLTVGVLADLPEHALTGNASFDEPSSRLSIDFTLGNTLPQVVYNSMMTVFGSSQGAVDSAAPNMALVDEQAVLWFGPGAIDSMTERARTLHFDAVSAGPEPLRVLAHVASGSLLVSSIDRGGNGMELRDGTNGAFSSSTLR